MARQVVMKRGGTASTSDPVARKMVGHELHAVMIPTTRLRELLTLPQKHGTIVVPHVGLTSALLVVVCLGSIAEEPDKIYVCVKSIACCTAPYPFGGHNAQQCPRQPKKFCTLLHTHT